MLKWILAPALGCVIGYITNALAIKMLFRPRKAIYIGRFHVPFTPGIIPSQKDRIAASIGSVISSQLLDSATLESTFLSETILNEIRKKLNSMLGTMKTDDHTLREKLSEYIESEKILYYEHYIQKHGAALIVRKLLEADIGRTMIDTALNSMKSKTKFKLFANFLDDFSMNNISKELGGKVNQIIASRGCEIIEKEIGHMEDDLLNHKVCALYEKYEDKTDLLIDKVLEFYQSIVKENLGEILSMINIEKIVVDKISAFSAEELEKMIFDIMKKELGAIVYLGALLGFLMGFINLLF